MTEHDLTKALLRQLRARFPEAWVHKVNERIAGGLPDIEVILRGAVVKIECKGPKTDVTELQLLTMHKLARAGQTVLLLRYTGVGTKHELFRYDHLSPVRFVLLNTTIFDFLGGF
jgi:hypothetical protein